MEPAASDVCCWEAEEDHLVGQLCSRAPSVSQSSSTATAARLETVTQGRIDSSPKMGPIIGEDSQGKRGLMED
ncbi:hypothetical protein NHX12_016793 [Muraenolepis orangiensis]|uniref:Uncharacterized protein n=1 Tax=Muraenolepis orangiensis TaxID=630683 RepID=A0A9Q0I0U6_9TELE|nr:hypothetical protein NHX12_016793 [Muraenolepis orangiensis]